MARKTKPLLEYVDFDFGLAYSNIGNDTGQFPLCKDSEDCLLFHPDDYVLVLFRSRDGWEMKQIKDLYWDCPPNDCWTTGPDDVISYRLKNTHPIQILRTREVEASFEATASALNKTTDYTAAADVTDSPQWRVSYGTF